MNPFDNIVFELALIFVGVSVLATVFLYLRQPIILAYIGLGMLVGPWGLSVVQDPAHIEQISHIGIILLMFLIGLNPNPQKLLRLLRSTAIITLSTCTVFVIAAMLLTRILGFLWWDSFLVGLFLQAAFLLFSLSCFFEDSLFFSGEARNSFVVDLFKNAVDFLLKIPLILYFPLPVTLFNFGLTSIEQRSP